VVPRTRLLEGETVLLRPIHRHWVLLAGWAKKPAALVLVTIVLNLTLDWWLDLYYQYIGGPSGFADPRLSPVLPALRVAFTLLVLAVAGFWFISVWVRWSSLTLTITEHRIIIDSGIGGHSSHQIGIDRVLDVSHHRTPTGITLNYGTVKINGGDVGLDFIPYPEALAEDIFIHITNLKKGGAQDSEPGKKELQAEAAAAERDGHDGSESSHRPEP
jgi:membrane protein YdbS with pleckstrin-like domain